MKMRSIVRFALVVAFIAGMSLAHAETVMIPMRDGVKLATDVYLPPGDGPFSVVLARSVYGRGPGFNLVFNAMGLVFVVQDTRGRGDSEGKDRVFADDGWGENQDGADTVKWIKEQSWCNGKVGTWGASALSITQILMAPATSDLTCEALWVGSGNFYGQLSYQGGVFRKALCEQWTEGQGNGYILETWKAHPCYDAFWKGYNADAQAERITAPAIHVGGWWDIFAQGTLDHFVARQERGGEGAKGNQMLIMGPWLHGPKKDPGDLTLRDNFMLDFNGYTARFLNCWLKGDKNGVMDEPPVHYYTIGDTVAPDAPGNEWRTAETWPPFPTVETPYYLAPDGALQTAMPEAQKESQSYIYDPKDPCPTHGGANLLIPAGPFDQSESSKRPDVLTFMSAPLEKPVEITGRLRLELFVSTDAPDTDFTAKLLDVYPDGRQILMLDNIQRLKFRDGFEKPAPPLADGEVVKVTVDLWSISLIFNAGHRIGLQVSSSNYPRFEKNPNSGDDFPTEDNLRAAKNTVWMSQTHPSALVLPIRPPASSN